MNYKGVGNNVPAQDHLGNKFDSISEMCRFHKIEFYIFLQRFSKGWKLEDALTIPVKQNKTACTDHLGNKFDSIAAMCKHYNIPTYIYFNRRKSKKSLEQILTTEVKYYS